MASKNKQTAKRPPEPEKLQKLWDAGETECPSCRRKLSLSEFPPLQMHQCPKCKDYIFVPKKVGDYFLFEPGGAGGMGSVYKGVSTKFPGRVLAVKVLSRTARENPADIMALLNEARTSRHFQGCEYLAACLDGGYADDEYFTVMDFISGERLDKMIDRKNHLPDKDVVKIALHILAAEEYIYSRGYLFRDLKPENIIINPYGYAILIDFGLCITREKAADQSNNQFISGSPYYLPPERLRGEPENAASELYSLGMIMYQALQGRTYYDASEANDLAQRHLSSLRISSSAKMEGIRPSLAAILDKMIKQSNADRPQNFCSVFQALQGVLAEIG